MQGFPRSDISIVAPGGVERAKTRAVMTGELAVIDDVRIVVEPGDEIRRTLPNGREEVFAVSEATYYDAMPGGAIPAHYQVKYRRKGEFAPNTGGHYTVNVSGANARVNINSQDNSINTVSSGNIFQDMRQALSGADIGFVDRAILNDLIDRMEEEQRKPGFGDAYQKFIAAVGAHVNIVAPFLPYLAKLFA